MCFHRFCLSFIALLRPRWIIWVFVNFDILLYVSNLSIQLLHLLMWFICQQKKLHTSFRLKNVPLLQRIQVRVNITLKLYELYERTRQQKEVCTWVEPLRFVRLCERKPAIVETDRFNHMHRCHLQPLDHIWWLGAWLSGGDAWIQNSEYCRKMVKNHSGVLILHGFETNSIKLIADRWHLFYINHLTHMRIERDTQTRREKLAIQFYSYKTNYTHLHF